ncbi:MAG: methyltransferase domain-containing protein [Methylobacteriaceae bacterium]|nr:methyltransferase domain-containing protein [Methylobacteriaceae bacterium]MCC0002287.1 methyltransferase domain-containing protein [Methylobacteriaceae bacterium]HPG03994.1 class I SAM-dependent methyltransferase [Rhodoblastus sp.]
MTQPACRFCGAPLTHDFVDLGSTPLSNAYLTRAQVEAGLDRAYPLHARVCDACFLVQVDAPVEPERIFDEDYAYFSSYSASWVEHARRYAQAMIARFGLDGHALVVEAASNDGYLLQHFVAAGVPVLGVEPAGNAAEAARARGVRSEVSFFNEATARSLVAKGFSADLTAANNVLAHVPDIADFVRGFSVILKPEGVSTFEFPHVLNLIRESQFDTIYHEHYSYLSLVTVEKVLAAAGMRAFDVEELATHGGSLRLYACRANASHEQTDALVAMRDKERAFGLHGVAGYAGFAAQVEKVKSSFRAFLELARSEGKTIAAYGAAAKGNTFLNVCGVTPEDIACVYDLSHAKQGRLLPGSHIPILSPDQIDDLKPDYLVILPWNLRDEIIAQMDRIRTWGGRFVTAVPDTQVFD